MTVDAPPAWCARLLAEFTDADARARAVAGTLTREQLNWKPGQDAWSVGQCLEHLAIANELYIDAIEATLTENLGARPVQEITLGRPSRWFIRNYIEPSAEMKRSTAPGMIRPAATVGPGVLDRFLRSNERIRAIARRAADYDVNRIRFKNPFVPVIRFTIGTGFEILSRHQARHLLQAERVKSAAES